jgi:hypothetical protein
MMARRTQLAVGVGLVGLVVGYLVGGARAPSAHAQETAEGRAGRFALVTGIGGNVPNSQTLYLVDERHELLFAFEYGARRKPAESIEFRGFRDLRQYIRRALKLREDYEARATEGHAGAPGGRSPSRR